MPMVKDESLKPFSEQAKLLVEGEVYEHYKGSRYKILCVGRNSETLEESVVYQAENGDKDVWIRPLSMFLENIDLNGKVQPRFRRIK